MYLILKRIIFIGVLVLIIPIYPAAKITTEIEESDDLPVEPVNWDNKLISAVTNSDTKEVEEALKKGANANVLTSANKSVLSIAIENKDYKIVKLLIDYKANAALAQRDFTNILEHVYKVKEDLPADLLSSLYKIIFLGIESGVIMEDYRKYYNIEVVKGNVSILSIFNLPTEFHHFALGQDSFNIFSIHHLSSLKSKNKIINKKNYLEPEKGALAFAIMGGLIFLCRLLYISYCNYNSSISMENNLKEINEIYIQFLNIHGIKLYSIDIEYIITNFLKSLANNLSILSSSAISTHSVWLLITNLSSSDLPLYNKVNEYSNQKIEKLIDAFIKNYHSASNLIINPIDIAWLLLFSGAIWLGYKYKNIIRENYDVKLRSIWPNLFDYVNQLDAFSMTPQMWLIVNNKLKNFLELSKYCIKNKISNDLTVTNINDETPIMLAVKHKRDKMLEILIKHMFIHFKEIKQHTQLSPDACNVIGQYLYGIDPNKYEVLSKITIMLNGFIPNLCTNVVRSYLNL